MLDERGQNATVNNNRKTAPHSFSTRTHLFAYLHYSPDEVILILPPAGDDAGAEFVHDGTDAVALRREWRGEDNERRGRLRYGRNGQIPHLLEGARRDGGI